MKHVNNNGRFYWRNDKTDQTVWTKPENYQDPMDGQLVTFLENFKESRDTLNKRARCLKPFDASNDYRQDKKRAQKKKHVDLTL